MPTLAGVPLALKDNINLKGYKTTASSKILENFVSPFDATVSIKLKENLIPVIGKTNLDEFAMGSSNENSAFKKVHNPYDLNKVPGVHQAVQLQALQHKNLTLHWGLIQGVQSGFLQAFAA